MASRYTLSAELPATRKSLQRSGRHPPASEAAVRGQPPLPSLVQPAGADEKICVSAHPAWTQPSSGAADRALHDGDATVRKDLSLRRGGTRGGKDATLSSKSEFDTSIAATYDDRGLLVLKGEDRFGLTTTAFTENKENDEGRKRSHRLAYLEGLRGILGLQVLVWTFFRIFAPAIVADRDLDGVYPAAFLSHAPEWQNVLRKALSPLLFDGELQAAMFVILSGRASLHTFVERRVALGLSGAAFKRPFRFLFPMAITLALVSLVIAVNGFRYAPQVSAALENQLAQPPQQFSSALEYFNSILFFFSTQSYFKTARATLFIPPSGTLWIIPMLFQQTYVMIIVAFTLPYTILRYKNLGMILLILTTAWVGRWSWYTLTGLLLAEWSTVYLQLLPSNWIPVNRQGNRRIPIWLPGLLFVLLGTTLKYLWIAALPQDFNNEYVAHVDGNTGKLNYSINPALVAYPRYDNWLLATGLLYLVEISATTRRILANKVLVYIGRWAFSIALISGTVMLSLGSLLWHLFTARLAWQSEAAVLAVLFVTLVPASLLVAEVYARVVDDISLWITNWLFKWVRE